MKFLLDTHVFLWYISGDEKLSTGLRGEIDDINNDVYLSVVSFWEIVIKNKLGKLTLPEPPEIYIPKERRLHNFASLAVYEKSVALLASLPPEHRDPFDRMIICQALSHDLTIVTADAIFSRYDVPTRNT